MRQEVVDRAEHVHPREQGPVHGGEHGDGRGERGLPEHAVRQREPDDAGGERDVLGGGAQPVVPGDGDGRELQPLQAGRRAVRGRAGERPFPVQNRPHRHARRGRHVVDHAAQPVEQGRAPRVRVRHERERKRRLPFRLSPNSMSRKASRKSPCDSPRRLPAAGIFRSTSIHYLFAAASLRDGVPAR